jgi:hypothetical protein
MKRTYWAILFFVVCFSVYFLFANKDFQHLNYFVPLADSFIHGKVDIESKPYLNELVSINNKYYVVYPPMPAVVLIPIVFFTGLNFNQTYASIFFAALAVAIFFLLTDSIFKKRHTSILLTILFAFGTNFFFTALVGSSWYIAHILAVFFLLLALYFVYVKNLPIWSGIFLACAFLSRLPVILAIPIFIYIIISKNQNNKWLKISYFLIPIIIAIALFGFYNFYRFGSFLQAGYPLIPGVLNEPWYSKGILSISYVSRNLQAMFWTFAKISTNFPYFLPSNFAMAIWLATPALLLIFWTNWKNNLVKALLLTALLVAIPNLTHGCVGFSQFGYRFSLDFIIFLLIPLGFAIEKINWKITLFMVALSLLVNFWVAFLYLKGIFHV